MCVFTSAAHVPYQVLPEILHRLLRRDVEWEGEDVWFAHCCFLDEAEVQQLAEKGMGVAHCPSSNLRLASGELQENFLVLVMSVILGMLVHVHACVCYRFLATPAGSESMVGSDRDRGWADTGQAEGAHVLQASHR